MKIQAAIFDFGNVINRWQPADAIKSIYPDPLAAEAAMERLGFKQWVGEILDAGGDVEASLASIYDENAERHALFATYMQHIEIAHATPIEGTTEIIHRLASIGIRVVGMTNAGIAAYEALQRLYPVIDMMEDVFVSGHEKCLKPQAEAFERLLSRNGLDASACIFIDDAERNVAGARAVGIQSILFSDAAALESALAGLGLLPAEELK